MLQRRSLRFVQALLRCYWLLVCFNAAITDCFCGPCNRDNCVALNSTVCPYGTIFDGCCCMMCAKGPGEECGGIKLELCATGSRCMLEIEFGLFYSEYIQSSGICKLSEKLLLMNSFTFTRFLKMCIYSCPLLWHHVAWIFYFIIPADPQPTSTVSHATIYTKRVNVEPHLVCKFHCCMYSE